MAGDMVCLVRQRADCRNTGDGEKQACTLIRSNAKLAYKGRDLSDKTADSKSGGGCVSRLYADTDAGKQLRDAALALGPCLSDESRPRGHGP